MLIVDQKGKAVDVVVVEPLGCGLDEKAVEAARKWKIEPAMKEGQPVRLLINAETSFLLF